MIKLSKVTFTYNEACQPALCNIDLEIQPGEFMLVTGPSGSGKSSLCRLFNGLIPHFYGGTISGSIEVCGMDTLNASTSMMSTRVGMVFQDPESQVVTSSVEREICFGMENMSFSRELMQAGLKKNLKMLGISSLRNRSTSSLSGGEKQRTIMSSGMALDPDIIVLDEPASGLAPEGIRDLINAVHVCNREKGLTVVVVEHRLETVIEYADRLIVMDRGSIVIDEPAREACYSDYEKMTRLGIALPGMVDLFFRLTRLGYRLQKQPVSVREGVTVFGDICRPIIEFPAGKAPVIPGNAIAVIENLNFDFPGEIKALRNVNLKIFRGEILGILGPNGSGKTSLVKHLNGLLRPASGSVSVKGRDIKAVGVAEMAKTVGMLFQNSDDHFVADTVEDEIAFGLRNQGFTLKEVENETGSMLSLFDLNSVRDKKPRELSGGQKQRLALASVLVTRPPILVLDEPTRGMDAGLVEQLIEILKDRRQRGDTIILVSHDTGLVARLANRIIYMEDGQIVAEGTMQDVLSCTRQYSTQVNDLLYLLSEGSAVPSLMTSEEVARALS